MSRRLAFAASLFLGAVPAAAADAPVTPAEMRRHIEVLASDDFEGRAPATEGERRTTAYIVAELERRGLEPDGVDGSWFQRVDLVQRRPASHRVRWTANGRAVRFGAERIILVGRDERQEIADAPVTFVGHGYVDRARGIDQLAGADLQGAVALMLVESPAVPGFPGFSKRVRTVTEAGAAAVIGIVSDDLPWRDIVEAGQSGQVRLAAEPVPAVRGAMPAGEAARLVRAAGGDLAALMNEQPGPAFRAVPLALRAGLEVESRVRRYSSNNVVGRIRGSGGGGESVLLLGHWDHLGICRPEGAGNRICNGAVGNGSGIAMPIEIAGRLARERPERDVLVLATTGEEDGLLGAEHFAAAPPVPLGSIVAAINFDTVAIHGPGEPVGVIGRGLAPLDAAIAETAAAMGRRMDETFAADALVTRQDGWALARAGVPAVMVGGSFGNMALLQRFLAGAYHGPEDEIAADLPLGGAAEDANLIVALVRRLPHPARYAPPPPQPPATPAS